jgi:hypothetical protein
LSKKSITLDLPMFHTDKVSKLSKVAGIENLESLRNSGNYVLGCYRIYEIDDSYKNCYIE